MKVELTKLLSSIIKVKDFNHSLLNSLSKRTSLYYNLISENEDLKRLLHQIKSKKNNLQNNEENNSIFNEKNEYFKKSDRSNKSYSYKILKNNNHSLTDNNFILKKQKNQLNKSHFSKKLLLNTKLNNFVMYQEQSKLENKILENVSNINSSTNINI